jgi:hypothetical protein
MQQSLFWCLSSDTWQLPSHVPSHPPCHQGNKTPLYSHDVTKVDHQDNNAAVRLFSADVLKYLADNHPDYVGEIVYLFVFGELINAYQNLSMHHLEHIKLVL